VYIESHYQYRKEQEHQNQALFTLHNYLPPYLPPPPPKDRIFASWGGISWFASLRIVTNSPAIFEALSVKNETANPFAPARPGKMNNEDDNRIKTSVILFAVMNPKLI
jgi:hypothetical protein